MYLQEQGQNDFYWRVSLLLHAHQCLHYRNTLNNLSNIINCSLSFVQVIDYTQAIIIYSFSSSHLNIFKFPRRKKRFDRLSEKKLSHNSYVRVMVGNTCFR